MSYGDMMAKHPKRAVEKAVKGCLPKHSLRCKDVGKLKVYAGPRHKHQASKAAAVRDPASFAVSRRRKEREEKYVT